MVPVRRLGAPRAHIDEELESDFAQREKKKSKRGTGVVGDRCFHLCAYAKTGGDWEPIPAPWRCSQLLLHLWDKSLIIFSINIKCILLWFGLSVMSFLF